MKIPRQRSPGLMRLLATGCFALIALTACNKSPSGGVTGAAKSYPQVSTNALAQRRYEWNIQTLVGPYEKAGFSNPKWDEPVRRALTEFARVRSQVVEPDEPWGQVIATNCELAVKAGCNDPLVAYFHTRFSLDQTNSREAFADAFCRAALGTQQSSYPSIRKFYVSLRAVNQLYSAYGTNANQETIRQIGGNLQSLLLEAIGEKDMPPGEVYDAISEGLEAYKGNKKLFEEFYHAIEKPLFANWTNESMAWLCKGESYIEMAWDARGGGYASTVTDEGWKLFSERLEVAEEALGRAWEMDANNPRIPLKMLTVELGQGRGRERMELWFDRAMALDPNYYDACHKKLYYLEPKWHGSDEDMIAFGWECVESKTWGGKVPLILLDAHVAISRYLERTNRDDYWKRPEVWPDIEASFDRFFELNPNWTSWYHNYAWYAYHCQRWDKLNELIPRLGTVNYSYFGGRKSYNEMVRLAGEHANDVLPKPDSLMVESRRLMAGIASKARQGKDTEKDFENELKRCDALLDKYKDRKTDDVAQILFAKAMLHLQTFDDAKKARELIIQLKQDFPETKLAAGADQILTMISKQEEADKIQRSLAEGTAFPDFDEKDVSGRQLSLSGYRGRVVLIDFWATWCGPCVAELPNVLETYEKYHDGGFDIIGISLDEDQARLENFTKQKSMTWQQFFDGQGWSNKLAVKCGVQSIPATFLLDGEGKIIAKDLRGEELQLAVAKALSKK